MTLSGIEVSFISTYCILEFQFGKSGPTILMHKRGLSHPPIYIIITVIGRSHHLNIVHDMWWLTRLRLHSPRVDKVFVI